jgi:hypothetical protein
MATETQDIENKAVNAVVALCDQHGITPQIKTFSSEPTHDGYIVWQEDDPENSKAAKTIFVQVKGTTDSSNLGSFPVEVNDLLNFELHGVVYFVVTMKWTPDHRDLCDTKVYGRVIAGNDVKDLLPKKKEQKTVTLGFRPLRDKEALLHIVQEYCLKQKDAIELTSASPEILKKGGGKIRIFDFESSKRSLPEVGKTYYAHITDANGMTYFCKSLTINSRTCTEQCPIKIKDTIFFSTYKKIEQSGKIIMQFNPALTVPDPKGTLSLKLELGCSVKDVYDAALFLKTLLIEKQFSIGNRMFSLENSPVPSVSNFSLDTLCDNLSVTSKFLSEIDFKEKLLVSTIIPEAFERVKGFYDKSNTEVAFHSVQFKDSLYIFLRFLSQGEPHCINVFNEGIYDQYDFHFSEKGKQFRLPSFAKTTIEQWNEVTLPDFDTLREQIMRHTDFSEETSPIINDLMCLRLISAFDLSKKEILLALADFLLSRLSSAVPARNMIYRVNRLQIKKRRGIRFSYEEKTFIHQLIDNDDPEYKICGYALFEDSPAGLAIFNSLPEEEKKKIILWPIFKFLKEQ